MSWKDVLTTLSDGVSKVASDEKIKKMIFGTYSNGKSRSILDSLDGEILSPKDREKYLYKKDKKHKKKKKKKVKKAKIRIRE